VCQALGLSAPLPSEVDKHDMVTSSRIEYLHIFSGFFYCLFCIVLLGFLGLSIDAGVPCIYFERKIGAAGTKSPSLERVWSQ
jgi:hypothetical protein